MLFQKWRTTGWISSWPILIISTLTSHTRSIQKSGDTTGERDSTVSNAETSTDRDGNEMSITTTPNTVMPTVRGMQGQTWSETIRTDGQYYEMAFPRVLAVAERAWHRASWELELPIPPSLAAFHHHYPWLFILLWRRRNIIESDELKLYTLTFYVGK